MTGTRNWRLITRFITGEAEESEIELKINTKDRKNRILLDELKEVQNMIVDYKNMKKVDVDKAWENVIGRINSTNTIQSQKSKRIIPLYLKIAASVLIIAGLFGIYKLTNNDNYITAFSSQAVTMVELPDGSKVYLNSNSKIRYDRDFRNNRNIFLYGEAFFEVIPDAYKPFIVSAGNSKIKVLGTSFLVKKSENSVKVYVETGKVSFFSENNEKQAVLLNPGETGTFEKNIFTTEKNSNSNILSWKTKKIIFTDENFSEIAKVLEDVYKVKIDVKNPEKGDCPRTVKFVKNQSIDEILNVLGTESFTFKQKKSSDKIVIELEGCK